MYRLMKSEKTILDPLADESMSHYAHTQLEQFPQLAAALAACAAANDKTGSRHYVLDAVGKEYYQGTWIN